MYPPGETKTTSYAARGGRTPLNDERTTSQGTASTPTWETLHTWLRGQVQGLIQRVLEEEVREFFGTGAVPAAG